MKRVLIVASDGLTKSGVPNVFMSIIKGLNSKKYVFDVLYFDNVNAFYKKEIEVLGGRAIYCPIDTQKTTKIKKLLVKMKYKRAIKKTIKESGPYDCVHSFKGFESGYVLKASKELKIPVRVAHMTFLYNKSSNFIINAIEKKEQRLTKKYATLIISDSINTSNNNVPGCSKSIVIRNSVDNKMFSFSELDKKVKPISMIQIGSYCENKNQLFSLLVFKNVIKQYPDSVLHFVGFRNPDDYGYLDKIKEKIKNENLTKNIVFHDSDVNIKDLFEKCHFLLFPSHRESFGIVPVEAQMSGLSCFCSNTITKENNCGGCEYLSLEDAELWAKRIMEKFNNGGGKHVLYDCSAFYKDVIISKYELIYKGVNE